MGGLDELGAYLPAEVRHALARGIELPGHAQGAALFADMSGFTALSAAYADALGPAHGAEALTDELRKVFEALIREVHDHRGSVTGFSGDAITCWFEHDTGLPWSASARAGAAAVAMRRAVAALPPVETPQGNQLVLRVKVAAAAGPARRFIVGDPAVQRFDALGGATLSRMAAGESLAEPGDVLLAEEVVADAPDLFEVTAWRHDDRTGSRFALVDRILKPIDRIPWPDPPALGADVLRPWVLDLVRQRVERGEGGYLASFRPVVALFLRFSGIDYDGDPDAGDKLETLVGSVQRIVDGHGGHLVDITLGDKGSYLFAAFGALQAYEDAARRAVTSALALRSLGATFSFAPEVRIGIAQSQVYTGAYGCAARMTFGVVGSQVNVAARLMGMAAAGEVLATPHIAKSVAGAFELDRRPEVRLKGLSEPITPYLVVGDLAVRATTVLAEASADEMVGRRTERLAFDQALDALADGVGGGLVLEGEAGMGKSRLLAYAMNQAKRRDIPTFVGAADAMLSAAPYHPWRSVIEGALELDGSGDSDPRGESARRATRCRERLQAIDPRLVALVPLLNPVLALDLPDSDVTRLMEGRVRAENTNRVLTAILRAWTSARPTLILLEDLHWFDSSSSSLLNTVARDVPSCLVVATRRPPADEAARELAHDVFASAATLIRLGRLDPSDVSALLASCLQVDTLPESLLRFVEKKAEGSPFFSQEIAYALRDARHLEVTGRVCRVSPEVGDLQELDFPGTIQGVIAGRVDRLPIRQQIALKVASVVGRSFRDRVLHDVHPVIEDREFLPHSLNALDAASITLREPDQPEPVHMFRHVLTQEVAYDMLLHGQRRELHLAVAAWHEREYGGDLAPHYSVLAYHFGRAAQGPGVEPQVTTKAITYLESAGEQALRSHSNQEAVHFLLQAVQLGGGDRDAIGRHGATRSAVRRRQARWHSGLATAYLGLGRFQHCQRASRTALELLGHPLPDRSWVMAGGVVVQYVRQAVSHLRRRGLPERAVTGPEADALSEVNYLRRILSKSLFHENGVLGMMYLNAHSLNLAERLGPSSDLALVYSHMLLTLGVFQMHGWARDYGRRAIDVARAEGNAVHLVTVFVNHSLYHVVSGEWDDAARLLEEGRELAEDIGDFWQWGEVVGMQADIAIFRGDLRSGAALYAELFASAERRGMIVQMAWSVRPRVLSALRADRPADALEILDKSRGIWGEVPDLLVRIDAVGLGALAHARLGNVDAAMAHVREAQTLILTVTPPVAYPRLIGYAATAEACLTLWTHQRDRGVPTRELEALSRRACADLAGYARVFRIGRPAAHLYLGWHMWMRGSRRAAARHLRISLDTARSLGMRFDEAMAHVSIARYAAKAPPVRRMHLQSAREIFEASSASRELALVEAELDQPDSLLASAG